MSVEAEIRRRIAGVGPITFAEFMELALYHPRGGYYTSDERIGATGDFYTSPSVHPAFGALLAVQLFQMWELLERPSCFTVLEPGAGNGLLCRDILAAVHGLDDQFASSVRYVCADRRNASGYDRGLPNVSRLASSGLPFSGLVGCILSNELLDAMPVHQVTVEGGSLCEIYVGTDGAQLVTLTGKPSTSMLPERLDLLGIRLTEGQTAEINLALGGWVASAAQSLKRGFVLTVDYGRLAEELYSAQDRFRGTLTTFRDHVQTDDPLHRIGQQDMSAQVDFTTLARTGAQAGLDYLGYTSQSTFLDNLGLDLLERRPAVSNLRQAQASRVGMRELVRPGGLGDFKVMAQGKNVGKPELWGFHLSDRAQEMVTQMPTPIPTPNHLDLVAGRRPHREVELEMTWDTLWDGVPPSL